MGIDDIVLDSSAIVAFHAKEKYSDWVDKTLAHYLRFNILDTTPYEVFNALNVYRIRGLVNAQEYHALTNEAKAFLKDCIVHGYGEVIDSALKIASDTNTAIYDSAQVALAKRLRCGLLTLDINLYNKLEHFPALRNLLTVPMNS